MNVTALANINRVENGRGISELVVTLENGTTRTYNVISDLAMRSYKHVRDAIDNPACYRFTDKNGVLSIEPTDRQEVSE